MKQLSQVVAAGVAVLAVFSVTGQFNRGIKETVTDAAQASITGAQALINNESAMAVQGIARRN